MAPLKRTTPTQTPFGRGAWEITRTPCLYILSFHPQPSNSKFSSTSSWTHVPCSPSELFKNHGFVCGPVWYGSYISAPISLVYLTKLPRFWVKKQNNWTHLAPPVNCSKQTSQLRLEAIISLLTLTLSPSQWAFFVPTHCLDSLLTRLHLLDLVTSPYFVTDSGQLSACQTRMWVLE